MIKRAKAPPRYKRQPHIFRLICLLIPGFQEGESWEEFFLDVRETLFDEVGEVEDIENGFCCVPKGVSEVPIMIVDCVDKTVCFQLVGFHNEREMSAIINNTIENFSKQFETTIIPTKYERWVYSRPPKIVDEYVFSSQEKMKNPDKFLYRVDKTGNA
jgi:hypothetical protein